MNNQMVQSFEAGVAFVNKHDLCKSLKKLFLDFNKSKFLGLLLDDSIEFPREIKLYQSEIQIPHFGQDPSYWISLYRDLNASGTICGKMYPCDPNADKWPGYLLAIQLEKVNINK